MNQSRFINNTMEELEKLSYMYPSAITIIIVVIALLVLYVTGRSLAYVFKTTEEKLRSEPSIMTELDELIKTNIKLSTISNQLVCDPDIKDKAIKCYEERVEILEIANRKLETHCNEYKDLLDLCMTTLIERDNHIIELEKELSDLRSSCDDSFLNTVERANQLSLKCASLENIIAEFDVYKKDTQQTYDTLRAEYYNKIAEIDKLNKRIADMETTTQSKVNHSDLEWANWVVTDKNGIITACYNKPFKMKGHGIWNSYGKLAVITTTQAMHLCGRVPAWSNDEPTYVGKNL